MDLFEIIFDALVIIFLIFMNGFFVAAEFAVAKVRPSQLEMLCQQGNKQAEYAKSLVEHIDVSLSVTQLGITFTSLGLGWVGEPMVATWIMPICLNFGLGEAVGHTVSFTLAFAVITASHIVLGELVPKNMAIQSAEKVTLTIAAPLLLFQKFTYPFVWFLNHVANTVAGWMGLSVVTETEEAHSEDEIRILMEESHKHGFIDKTEFDFVDNVFEFADTDVRDIMTPRTEMTCLYLEDSIEENIRVAVREKRTRYPICREGKDDIIGFLHTKDLLDAITHGRRPNLRRLSRHALVVPESMSVSRLLKTMQKTRSQLAIVVDEYGGTAGMATIEDIIEELVGEIQDEFDNERASVEEKEPGLYSVWGRLSLEEVNEEFDLHIDDENVDTLGGWLYSQIEAPPVVGACAVTDEAEYTVEEVERMSITRVTVRLKELPSEKSDEEEKSESLTAKEDV